MVRFTFLEIWSAFRKIPLGTAENGGQTIGLEASGHAGHPGEENKDPAACKGGDTWWWASISGVTSHAEDNLQFRQNRESICLQTSNGQWASEELLHKIRGGNRSGRVSPVLTRQHGSHDPAVLLTAEAVTLNLGFMSRWLRGPWTWLRRKFRLSFHSPLNETWIFLLLWVWATSLTNVCIPAILSPTEISYFHTIFIAVSHNVIYIHHYF